MSDYPELSTGTENTRTPQNPHTKTPAENQILRPSCCDSGNHDTLRRLHKRCWAWKNMTLADSIAAYLMATLHFKWWHVPCDFLLYNSSTNKGLTWNSHRLKGKKVKVCGRWNEGRGEGRHKLSGLLNIGWTNKANHTARVFVSAAVKVERDSTVAGFGKRWSGH